MVRFCNLMESTDLGQSPTPPLSPSPVLPEELIVDILVKLPVRSLLRFRCVCKSWKTLISNPQFVKDHLHNSISDTSLTHQQLVAFNEFLPESGDDWEMVTCSVQPLFENPPSPPETVIFRVDTMFQWIVGSCNGLVCVCDLYGYFRLWNLSTRLTSEKSPQLVNVLSHCGFGYDQVNDKYKVIRLDEMTAEVHTFGTNSWKMIQSPPCEFNSYEGPHEPDGKFVSGTLNWLAEKCDVVISFDVEKETFGEVLLPPQLDGGLLSHHALNVVNDRLCFCYSDGSYYVVWLMKKFGIQESWTKLMSIPHCKLKFTEFIKPAFRPLCISENGVVMGKSDEFELMVYNTNSGKLDHLEIRGKLMLDIHIYHESLVSP